MVTFWPQRTVAGLWRFLPLKYIYSFQALHEQNLANTDHTTLLLNCYTKLKDVSKLDEFIMVSKIICQIQAEWLWYKEDNFFPLNIDQ